MPPSRQGFAEINGASLYYEIAGAGQPFIMLHGHLVDSRQWDDQFAAFSANHLVVRYDERGFGQSSLPPAAFSHVDDLFKLMQFLGLPHAILMGCSNGGSICLDFSLQHPDMVDGLILVDSSLGGYQPSGPMPPKVLAFVQARQRGEVAAAVELALEVSTDGARRKPQQVNPVARERARVMSADLFARPAVPQAVSVELMPPTLERLGEIHVPTLAITGAEDDPMFRDIAGIIAARIPGAQTVVIADAGHHPNLERPELFNEIVAKFLSEAQRD
jgi:3-oxoadipate enol-lactonase